MKLTFTATVEQFDAAKYRAAVNKAIRSCFMKAGQKFLLAAIPRVPVWTGMARGAFRNAEDLFGKVTNDVTSGVRIRTTQGRGAAGRGGGNKITSKFRRGYYYKPPGGVAHMRTPQSGRQYATPTDKILDSATLASGKTSFYFRFEVNITYLDRFESKWGAFKAGSDAVEAYVKAHLELPDPLKFMTRKLIK